MKEPCCRKLHETSERHPTDTPDLLLRCSEAQKQQLQGIARSTTAGIWRIKRAKVLLGTLEGKSVDRLVLDVRVPPMSIVKCLQRFAAEGMDYFSKPGRLPTPREESVERLLAFLDAPPRADVEEWDTLKHRYIGMHFTARQIRTIRDIIALDPHTGRTALAREICTRFDLRQSNGKLKMGVVPGILKRMEMDNLIVLPKTPKQKRSVHVKRPENFATARQQTLELTPQDIPELHFVPVTTKGDSELWSGLIREHHYIRNSKLFGARLRYLVYGTKKQDSRHNPEIGHRGVESGAPSGGGPLDPDKNSPSDRHLLAALGFASSAWRISSRDAFIGWSDEQRTANLRYVVSNAKFLILPWIKSPNLASRILSRVVRRLPDDWDALYCYKPVLLETFVQLDRFTGACYKAANWIQVGRTSGYSLYGKDRKKLVPGKAVFVYPLTRKFREVLCNDGTDTR